MPKKEVKAKKVETVDHIDPVVKRTRNVDVYSMAPMPEKIATLDSQIEQSDMTHAEFFDLLHQRIEKGTDGMKIKSLFEEILQDKEFYKREKHYIIECLEDQIEPKSIRQNGSVFNISGFQQGREINMWVKVLEPGHYDYGIANFTIGKLVHPKFAKHD
jgi:hypothetical protein